MDNHLLAVPDPTTVLPDKFSSFERVFYAGDHYPSLPNPRPVILRKDMTWTDLMGYFRTFSSLHNFHEQYPQDLRREDGDIAVRFWRRLKEEVASVDGKEIPSDDDVITIEWPLAMILARRA